MKNQPYVLATDDIGASLNHIIRTLKDRSQQELSTRVLIYAIRGGADGNPAAIITRWLRTYETMEIATMINLVATTMPEQAHKWLEFIYNDSHPDTALGQYVLGVVLGTFQVCAKVPWCPEIAEFLEKAVIEWSTGQQYNQSNIGTLLDNEEFRRTYEPQLSAAIKQCFRGYQGLLSEETARRVSLYGWFHKLDERLSRSDTTLSCSLASLIVQQLIYAEFGELTNADRLRALILLDKAPTITATPL